MLRWRQIDLSAGTMIHRTKADGKATAHSQALPPAAIELLLDLPGGGQDDVVFPGATAHADALRFMLLTLARRQEAVMARWGDVDFEARTWTIEDTKNGEPHTVPLSRQALSLLQSRLPEQPKPTALVFATSTGGPLSNWDRVCEGIQKASKTTDWSRHDLRRTGATMLGEMGELPDIIEAALNHTAIHSALAATYNRSRYRPQVAAALQRLADALDGIEAGAGKVLPLRTMAG